MPKGIGLELTLSFGKKGALKFELQFTQDQNDDIQAKIEREEREREARKKQAAKLAEDRPGFYY